MPIPTIILIGYRGTGKTTIAHSLAARLGCDTIDCDVEIERRAGKTIAEIFAQDGEPFFRSLERSLIAELLEEITKPLILSTGGGAVLHSETRKKLREVGVVVWLTAEPETILARLRGDESTATKRPSLSELPPLEEIQTMLNRRRALYEETAHLIVPTDGRGVEKIVDEIADAVRSRISS